MEDSAGRKDEGADAHETGPPQLRDQDLCAKRMAEPLKRLQTPPTENLS